MAIFPEKNLNQIAVYWGTPTENGYGKMTFADPVEIDCRWVSSTKIITTTEGKEEISRAEIQSNQDLDKQGMLFLGELSDLSANQKNNPDTVSTAYIIKEIDKIPTIKGNKFYRKAYL